MPRKKEYDTDIVLEKAMNTFWKNGYKNTSVRMLEKDMGINQFSIYSSFNSKSHLFLQVLKKYRQHIECNMLDVLLKSKSDGNLKDIRTFFSNYAHSINKGVLPNGCLMVNACVSIDDRDDKINTILKSYFDFIETTFYNVLEKAKANGEISPNVNTKKHASFLVVSLQGLSVYAELYNEREINNCIEIIMNALN